MLRRTTAIIAISVAGFGAPTAMSQAVPITTIINPGFEAINGMGMPPTSGGTISYGWSQIAGLGPMFYATANSSGLGGADPPPVVGADSGSWYAITNRQVPEPDYPTSQNMGIFQNVDLTPYASVINMGGRQMELSFAHYDIDPLDTAVVSYSFLNGVGSPIGSTYTFNSSGTSSWDTSTLIGEIPIGASSMRLELRTTFTGGIVRNISFDTVSANILPPAPPPPEEPSGFVNGNLIQFDGSGAWTWYSDERAIVDSNNGRVLVNSLGFASSYPSGGGVDVVNFDPETGRRVRTPLSNIQVDDHNNGALLVLPDGRYLAMYANHGNNGGLGDEFSRWRRSINPGDSTSWTSEQTFNWHANVPGANQVGDGEDANVSYHNLFYLAGDPEDEEDGVIYNISRSYGRLSTNGQSQNMPNILRYHMDTNSVEWAGQLLESEAQGYSAYPKYVSNGVNRIYFISTETHPRNYNNSIYAGYIENGQTFNMLGGPAVDDNIFDNGTVAGGSGFVPDVTDFTLVHIADPLGDGYNRLWTVDLNLDADGDPMTLYISRWNPSGCGAGTACDGGTANPIDHRLHFGRWNDETQQWETHEVAKMGNRLYRGTDLSEQDYTGNAALVPGDPSTIYVSTPYDPRDPSGDTFTTSYEIYKGVTNDGGGSWAWTAITENSVVDNLRPIIPDSHGGATTVMWFRGTYTTAHNINATVVGIVERPEELIGLVNYVDATITNTVRTTGAAIGATGPNGNAGATDSQWHQRTGFGNGGSVFTSSEGGTENAPMLRTTIDGAALEDGTYDIFAYFWSDNDEDWRLLAGLESNNLIDFRRYGSQHAEADQFATIETVSASSNDLLLYRAYLGRTEVVGGADIDVFIDDWQSFTGGAIRTWYDGVGYALVADTVPFFAGDFNADGAVDAADYVMWRKTAGSGGGYDLFVKYFGSMGGGNGSSGPDATPEPGTAAIGATLFLAIMLLTRPRRDSDNH